MEYPDYLDNVIEALKIFPGIGEKSAIRMALQLIDLDPKLVKQIGTSIETLSESIHYCSKCHNLSQGDLCQICSNPSRDKQIVCVVSNFKDIYAIEKMDDYKGLYHVLGGDIAINKGITPDKLNITSLLSRINQDGVKEIIIATNPTMSGETTALYLSKVLADYDVSVTKMALGLPIGANIDYIDELTMLKAFQNRIDFNNK